jgi:DNA (cytosine-5)-methyltransferase 3A
VRTRYREAQYYAGSIFQGFSQHEIYDIIQELQTQKRLFFIMNVLSLFDGISCGYLALKRAGIKVDKYYASEIEKHAEAVSRYNFPDIVRLGDVNNYEQWKLPQIDLLIGGSPCQDLSIAKAGRKGLQGEKSSLFFKYAECLKILKPKYFMLENNASMPKEAKAAISEIMGVEPILIDSALVSAQMRKRLYWTNIPVQQPRDKGITLQSVLESGVVDREKSLCLTRRYSVSYGSQDYFRRRYFGKHFGQFVFEGNATPEEHKIVFKTYGGYSGVEVDGYIRQMTHIECERLQTLHDNFTKYGLYEDGEIRKVTKQPRYEMIGNGWTVDVIAHIFKGLNNA